MKHAGTPLALHTFAIRSAMVCIVALGIGCAPSRSVRVEPVDELGVPRTSSGEPTRSPSASRSGDYVVGRGDTLYGIAFRHGIDYRDLARRNRIDPPYTIYPGQTLQLGDQPVASANRQVRKPAGATPRSTGAGLIASTASLAPATEPASRPPVNTVPQVSAAPPVSASVSETPAQTPVITAATVPAPVVNATPPPPATVAAIPTGPVRWRWPASGQTVSTFLAGDPTRQGIGIAGSNGQPVLAAGDGVVVYSGAGLIGYGELVIIKHSDAWLSAYGHNRKRLVAEGQAVKGGEQIAEMGRSGASRDMLHFEIRKNGKPVDPAALLPRR